MKLDELTLKEFDKNTKMMPLTFDVMFKSVFTRNLEILKEFLVDVLDLEYHEDELKIISNVQKKFFIESMRIRINYIFNLNL